MSTSTPKSAPAALPPSPPAGRPWQVPAALVVVLLLWASAFIVIRAVGDSFSAGPMALGRLVVGGLVLTVLALRRRRPRPRGRSLAWVAAFGLLWFAGYSVVLNLAERHLDAGTAAMLVNIAPLLVAVAAGLLLGEGFPPTLMIGIGIAFVGVVIIATGGVGGHSDGTGIVLGVVAAVLYAAGVLTQKVALRTVDGLTATAVGCLIGAVALLPFLPQTVAEVQQASASAILGVIYLGLFPTAIAFVLWAYVLGRSTAGRTASATLAVPAIAVLLSWIFLAEVPTALGLVGGTLCLVGVAISRKRPATSV